MALTAQDKNFINKQISQSAESVKTELRTEMAQMRVDIANDRVKALTDFVTRFEFNEFRTEVNQRFDRLEERFNQSQDTMAEILDRLDKNLVFMKNQITNNTSRIQFVEQHLGFHNS